MTSGLDDQAALEERQQRESFLDFLLGILDLDPSCRYCPHHLPYLSCLCKWPVYPSASHAHTLHNCAEYGRFES